MKKYIQAHLQSFLFFPSYCSLVTTLSCINYSCERKKEGAGRHPISPPLPILPQPFKRSYNPFSDAFWQTKYKSMPPPPNLRIVYAPLLKNLLETLARFACTVHANCTTFCINCCSPPPPYREKESLVATFLPSP